MCAGLPHFKIVAAHDVDAARRQAVVDACGAQPCADYPAMLARPDVEIVAIATPPQLHGNQALKAGQARKHLFMAEPIATQVGLADLLVRGMEREKQRLLVHYPFRTSTIYRVLQMMARSGVLGRLTLFYVEHHERGADLPGWVYQAEETGGLLLDRGVHFMGLARWILEAFPVSYAGAPHTDPKHVMDGALINVEYSTGVLASCFYDWRKEVTESKTVVRATFELGSVRIEGWIPEILEVVGLPDATAAKIAAILGSEVQISEVVDEADEARRLRFTIPTEGENGALRSLLNALGKAVVIPEATLPVTPNDALDSLKAGLKAFAVVERKRLQGITQP